MQDRISNIYLEEFLRSLYSQWRFFRSHSYTFDLQQIMQAFERDETTANLVEPTDIQCDQQLRIKLNELLAKKAQCDNILACIESENLPGMFIYLF